LNWPQSSAATVSAGRRRLRPWWRRTARSGARHDGADGVLVNQLRVPVRRSSTEKLSNQVMMPCSFTPLTRNTVTGFLPCDGVEEHVLHVLRFLVGHEHYPFVCRLVNAGSEFGFGRLFSVAVCPLRQSSEISARRKRGERRGVRRRQGSSSFLKKRTKKLLFCWLTRPVRTVRDASEQKFLVLFFKKELLPWL